MIIRRIPSGGAKQKSRDKRAGLPRDNHYTSETTINIQDFVSELPFLPNP